MQKHNYSKKEITAHTNTIKKMVRKCMNHLKKKEYELNITTADVDKAVAVTRIVNKSANATYVKVSQFKSCIFNDSQP